MKFDENYYKNNTQDKDRPALWMYKRLWSRYCSNGPVLDFGCGVGHLSRRLSNHAQVYGLEINPFAKQQILLNAPTVRVLSSLDEIPDSTLSSIISLHVLEHISDQDLDNIGTHFNRILKSGGRSIFVMPDLNGKASLIKKDKWLALYDPTHINLKSAEDWYKYFEEKWGMKVIRNAADGYYDFPYERWNLLDIFRLVRTGIQFVLGRLILKHGDGEAVIFVLEKP